MIRGTPHLIALLLLAALAILLVAFTWSVPPVAMPQFARVASDKVEPAEPLSPLPRTIPTPGLERAQLGERLFHELRLSGDDSVACASCHSLEQGGADGRARSVGAGGALGEVNAPSVFNAALGFAQFWDGRAADLKEQAKGPIQASVEMNNDPERVIATLRSMPEYVELFKRAFPDDKDPISFDNVTRAIEAFEATLITPNAPFDRYLQGDKDALTEQQKRGLQTFINAGCVACHYGVNLGGQQYFPFGVVERPGAEILPRDDKGRFEVTKTATDEYVFRAVPLRNVALTPPYFHSGKVWDLKQAVAIMGVAQLGRELSDSEIDDIVAFLWSLNGEKPRVELPQLPPRTQETPLPLVDTLPQAQQTASIKR